MKPKTESFLPKLSSEIREFLKISPHIDIVSWAEANIDLSGDVSAERSRLDLSLSPFLIDPLRAWDFHGRRREVTVCAIEQHGKTLLEVIGVLYSFLFQPSSVLCVYPSDEAAEQINESKYLPLIRRIPALAAELEQPRTARRDRYELGAATMYFQGAGRKIMSKSARIVVADEEEQFPRLTSLSPVEDMRKRTRSYASSLIYRVCTPFEESGSIWRSFLAGSQGYWTLRCLKCGGLTMRSCDLNNLQFEAVFDEAQNLYTAAPESIRLICPVCGHAHSETDRRAMNLGGAYVHKTPSLLDARPSFQFGALASQLPSMSWPTLAAKILESGKRADVRAHYELDNSLRGLPYRPRAIATEDGLKLKSHFFENRPPADTVEMVFAVSDTQDSFSPTGIFALDIYDNIFLIEYKNVEHLTLGEDERERLETAAGQRIETVADMVGRPQHFPGSDEGIRPLIHVIDYRGHRQEEVAAYARSRANVIMYAGAGGRMIEPWKPSTRNRRMMIVSAPHFQRELIWHLYQQRDREAGAFLFLPADLPQDTQKEILAVQPDKTRKSGHLPENWGPEGGAVHDAFDVLKMAYFAVDFAVKMLSFQRFRQGKSPALLRRHAAARKTSESSPEPPPDPS